eukprot:c47366_g1_i1 orf=95-1030(+)
MGRLGLPSPLCRCAPMSFLPSSLLPLRPIPAPPPSPPPARSLSASAASSRHPLSLHSACFGACLRGDALEQLVLPYRGTRERALLCRATTSGAGVGCSDGDNREILVQHLLVKEDQLQLLIDLECKVMQEGHDLSDLATEYSICSSKSEGGVLGWIQKSQTVPEFEEAAFNAPINKLVRVKTKYGWHLLQVLSQREASFVKEVQPEELYILLTDSKSYDEAQLIDVRELDEISAAAIKGFKSYPLSQFANWAPTIINNLDPLKDTYVLCHHGIRSLQTAHWLQTQGFRRVYNISGGIHAFSLRADKSIPVY